MNDDFLDDVLEMPPDNVSVALRDLSRLAGTMQDGFVRYRWLAQAALEQLHLRHVEASRRDAQHAHLLNQFRDLREERDRLAAENASLRRFLLTTEAA